MMGKLMVRVIYGDATIILKKARQMAKVTGAYRNR